MTTVSQIPCLPLRPYIERLWYTHGPAPYAHEKILPSPDVDLMINFGDPFQVYAVDGQQPPITCSESWWVGLQSHYRIVAFPANTHILSVSFKPGGAYPFLQLPLSDLRDRVVSSDALWGRLATEIRQRLYHVAGATERIVLLERFLLTRLCEVPPGWDAIQVAVGRIAQQHGVISIRALSEEVNMSQKHLIAQCKRMIGITPKMLARIYRFQRLLGAVNPRQPVDWAALAHRLSYYDQSHFNRDLKAFTGLTPTAYLRRRRQVFEVAPEHANHLHHLPTG